MTISRRSVHEYGVTNMINKRLIMSNIDEKQNNKSNC